MKALIISNYVYPERGLSQLISILAKTRVKVDLLVDSCRGAYKIEMCTDFSLTTARRGGRGIQKYTYKVYPFLNRWKKFIDNNFHDPNWDCIFVRETLLLNTALRIGEQMKIPVFLDMRENRPEMILSNVSGNMRYLGRLYAKLIEIYENIYVKRANHIFAVSQELKEWTIRRYNVVSNKISPLPNYPDASMAKASGMFRKKVYDSNERLRLVFAGHVNPSRGLQHIIPALQVVKGNNKKASLHIVGRGRYLDELKLMVSELGLEKEVSFQDLVPPADLIKTLSRYDVGLAPYIVNSHTNVTVPGKLFEYMAAGLPILSSERKSVVRILRESGSGLVYYGTDSKQIASKIVELMKAPLRERLGMSGVQAIRERYAEDVNVRTMERILNGIVC